MKTQKLFIGSFFALVLATAILTQSTYALYNTTDPWLTYRHDLTRTGYATTTAPNANTSLLWTWTQYYSSSPVVTNGMVIFATNYGIYALDETTGVMLWGPIQLTGTFNQPISYDGGKIYAGTSSGYMYCLNATNGVKIWEYQASQAVTTATAVANGKVYFGTAENYLYALNALTGAHVWHYTAPNKVNSNPAVDGTWIYFGCDDGSLFALNDTGSLPSKRWQFTTAGRIHSTPVIANGMVFIGSSYNEHTLFALNKTTGKFIWGYVLSSSYYLDNPVAFYNGHIFLTASSNKAYCLDSAATPGFNYSETDPSIRIWSQTLAYNPSAPVVADGKVFIGAYSNYFYALDAATGQISWLYHSASAYFYEPVIADGRVFVPTYSSLMCFGDPFPPVLYDFNLNVPDHGSFDVQIRINATILGSIDLRGLLALKKINFTVQGISGKTAMTNLTIPTAFLGGPYIVTVDGGLPNEPPGVQVTTNGTHSFIYFEYPLSTHTIEITGTTVVPEYPPFALISTLILSTLSIAAAATYVSRSRKAKKV